MNVGDINDFTSRRQRAVRVLAECRVEQETRLVAEQKAARHRHAVHRVVQQVRQHRQVARHLRARHPVLILCTAVQYTGSATATAAARPSAREFELSY